MNLLVKSLLLSTLYASSGSLKPQDEIKILNPNIQGTACSMSDSSITLSPDQGALSILFDSYRLAIDSKMGIMELQKNCLISFNLHVPKGKKVGILGIDLRGYNFLSEGAKTLIKADFNFPDNKGPKKNYTFNGPLDEDFLIHSQEVLNDQGFSPCGKDQHIKINTNIKLSILKKIQRNSKKKKFPKPLPSDIVGLSTIESFDSLAGNGPDIGLTYKIVTRDCQ